MDTQFINDHKSGPKAFSRIRKLTFIDVFILIFRNSIKSLQLMLNEFVLYAKKEYIVTASAFTQARKKLKHTAFIELNEGIVSRYYQEKSYKKLNGFRLLAFDGSKLTLPNNAELKKEFGSKPIGNHTGKSLGEYCRATFEACYDVLNQVAVNSVLGNGNAYEVDLVNEMLDEIGQDDLLIFDRGYFSYEFMANLIRKRLNFLIRCTKSSFIPVQNLFEDKNVCDAVVSIAMPGKHVKRLRKLGLPSEIKIRLVKVVLLSGEVEVLATTLMRPSAKRN